MRVNELGNSTLQAMDATRNLEQAQAAAALLLGLARHLLVADHDPAAELPLGQLRVCGILYRGPRRMSALGRELGVSLSAMTQIADRLERARLVRRVTEGADRRIRCLRLTPRGETIMRRREEARLRRILAALAHLSPEARTEVLAALERLVRACEACGRDGLGAKPGDNPGEPAGSAGPGWFPAGVAGATGDIAG
jgi:DNA-binding MarR family transcriptional regulator